MGAPPVTFGLHGKGIRINGMRVGGEGVALASEAIAQVWLYVAKEAVAHCNRVHPSSLTHTRRHPPTHAVSSAGQGLLRVQNCCNGNVVSGCLQASISRP